MSTSIDWAKLTRENRVKAPGIPWTTAEMRAIHEKGMDPEDVRSGFTDPSELDNSGAPKKLEQLKKAELVIKAKELGIDFDEKIATKGDLILEIKKAETKLTKEPEQSDSEE